MIYNPKLTLKTIEKNKTILREAIYELLETSLNDSGIKITPESQFEILNKINHFIYEAYSNPCKQLYSKNQDS
jgi:predicted nucleic-acid-binding protein